MHIDRIPVYRAYQRTVDLDLYHAFAELVVQTSQDDTAGRTYRQMRTMQIWQPESDVFGYFEPYNLRYPGEVLERFEEKLGDDVRVLRALALALGNTCAIQSDNMFVGNQRGTFLQRYGGLQEKMCTCRALCICWKRIPPSGIACWMNWRQRYMSERRRPCLYCRCLMMSNTVIGPCTTSCFDC